VIVIPAIDLHQGKVVRLKKGVFEDVTIYSEDPCAVALSFAQAGARRIHVVDLDGSVAGKGMNVQAIRAICSSVDVPVELGGGIRSEEDAQRMFDLGVSFIILGTVTVKAPDTALRIIERFPGCVGIGIDALNGHVALEGWKEVSERTAIEVARYYEQAGPAFVVYTDISRDGMLTGPNIDATALLASEITTPVIASGGVSGIDDIRSLLKVKDLFGAIVGKAIYEGFVNVHDAVQLTDTFGLGKG
jgi:phosphoribosylformimino-5-aminoimidazole carboxamide ribotide isomerase